MKNYLLLPLILLIGSTSYAQTTPLTASASVNSTCSIRVEDFSFGAISDIKKGTPAGRDNPPITVKCSNKTNYKITGSAGNGPNTNNRYMKSVDPTNTDIILYTISTGSFVFGEGDSSGRGAFVGVGTGSDVIHRMAIWINPNQKMVKAGDYTDTIVLTVIY